MLLHTLRAHAPFPRGRGGPNKPVLEALQSLARLERETLSLLEGKLALRLRVAFYVIFRLPIHFAVKMASGSGVGVVCEEALVGGQGVASQRGISCTRLASQHLLAVQWPGFKTFPVECGRRVCGIAEVSRVGVLRPPQPPGAVRRVFALYRSGGRLASVDAVRSVPLGVGYD